MNTTHIDHCKKLADFANTFWVDDLIPAVSMADHDVWLGIIALWTKSFKLAIQDGWYADEIPCPKE